MNIDIYTDGGCSGNPGPGGWAYVILLSPDKKTVSGGEPETTNNRMELQAVLQSLKDVQSHDSWKNASITLYTDSQYVKRGITEWIHTWVKNGWKTSGKKPVKNQDLWKEILSVSSALKIEWKWVKGHAGDDYNELCDAMVQEEIGKYKEKSDKPLIR